jgi:1,4-dihydroxy-2-naphthoate polyprenyltransferase
MKKGASWVKAMRLRTLPLSFSTILTGSALAIHSLSWSWIVFVMTLITTLLLQVLSNFANDYGDFVKGTDNEQRIGPARTMQSGEIGKQEMKLALIITSALTLISGILLLYIAMRDMKREEIMTFFAFGCASIAAALFYTIGKRAYGYSGWGDFFVFIFFGLLGVAGSFYIQSHHFNYWILLPASGIGLLCAGVLNLNNLRDHQNDYASGKYTLVVKMGYDNAKKYHYFLVITGLICLVFFMTKFFSEWYAWLPVLTLPLFIIHLKDVKETTEPAFLDPQLKKLAISTFLFSILLFAGQIIHSFH